MNTKELMIGDWVSLNDKPLKMMNVINEESWRASTKNEEDSSQLFSSLIKPIPITSEILEKNRFHKTISKDIEGYVFWTFVNLKLQNMTVEPLPESCPGYKYGYRWRLHVCTEKCFSTVILIKDAVHELQHVIRMADLDLDKEFEV